MVTIPYGSEGARENRSTLLLLGALSSGLLLLGSCLLYGLTGLTSFEGLYMLSSFHSTAQSTVFQLSLFVLGVGLLFKIAAVPFHNWAIDVYDGVPTIVTTWISTMPKISVIIFVLALQRFNPFNDWFSFKGLFFTCASLGLVVGSIGSLSQHRIKRLLAYSSVSHMGFILTVLALNNNSSIETLFFYMIQYFLTSINVFFILIAFGSLLPNVTSIYSPILLISQLRGQFQSSPLLSLCLALCLFSMAGIPPMIGFFAKMKILLSVIYNGYYFIAIIIILTSVISAAYYLKIIRVVHFDRSPSASLTGQVEGQGPRASSAGGLVLSSTLSFMIATLTLLLTLFILNPSWLLSSVHLLSLSLCGAGAPL